MSSIQNKVVSPAEWQEARKPILAREKEATHAMDAIAKERQNLPMVKVNDPSRFKFTTPDGEKSLTDLFAGRKQLILYHFMLYPKDKDGCGGCSLTMDHIPHGDCLKHLESRNTTFVAVAPTSLDHINEYKERMGWKFPFFSSENLFTAADEAKEEITWKPDNGLFGFCCFIKEGDEIYHTYSTSDRGVEIIMATYQLLDMTAMGRQEKGNQMNNFKLHYKY